MSTPSSSESVVREFWRLMATNDFFSVMERFRINRLVATPDEVVTHVSIEDAAQHAEAVSFFTLSDGKILRLVEYWPEPYAAPENRQHLSEPIF